MLCLRVALLHQSRLCGSSETLCRSHGRMAELLRTTIDESLSLRIFRGGFGEVRLATYQGRMDAVYAVKIMQKRRLVAMDQVSQTLRAWNAENFWAAQRMTDCPPLSQKQAKTHPCCSLCSSPGGRVRGRDQAPAGNEAPADRAMVRLFQGKWFLRPYRTCLRALLPSLELLTKHCHTTRRIRKTCTWSWTMSLAESCSRSSS